MQIAQEAVDFVVAEEVTSKAYYIRHYTSPEWPGGASGITIGIGYDLGQVTRAQIMADWGTLVSQDMLAVMMRCAGVKGDAARRLLPLVKSAITIPWDAAMDVFMNRDIPHYTAAVLQACPGTEKLNPLCLGVLVSLAYNRGWGGFNAGGDRYLEMRTIRSLIESGHFDAIPEQFERMARLWPGDKAPGPDLRGRRKREADLFRKGLALKTQPALAPVATTPAKPDPAVLASSRPEQPARTPQPPMQSSDHAKAGAIVVAGAVVAQQTHAHGFGYMTASGISVGTVLIAIIAWIMIYRDRNPK